jgi:hypothetical protein
VAGLGIALLGGVLDARAELPPLIPRAVLFGNPERVDPQISPDGRYLAHLRPDSSNVLQVWVRTIGQDDDRPITRDPKRGIWIWFTAAEAFLAKHLGGRAEEAVPH